MSRKVRKIEVDAYTADLWSPEALEEDERRLAEFERTRMGLPWDEVKAWTQSWGKPNELPMPKSCKV